MMTTEVMSPSKVRKYLDKLIETDRTKLNDLVWYVQYVLPFDQRIDKTDDGLRAFVFPPNTVYLPSIPVDNNVDVDSKLSTFHYYNQHLKPQIDQVALMLSAIESMYRMQRAYTNDLGRITFHRQLTVRSMCDKLGYVLYTFPDHECVNYDFVCPLCGGVSKFNVFLERGKCNNC